MIDSSLSKEDRSKEIKKIADEIVATDGEITSLTIPYPNGRKAYIYIDKNNEFAIRLKNREIVYHYDEDTDTFSKEVLTLDREER